METQNQSELISRLQNKIRGVETASRNDNGTRISSGCVAIDRLLPGSGYQRGTLIQWLTGGGQGADYLSLLVAQKACEDGGAMVVFDPLNQFYPPAAAAIGINLDNLIILRSKDSSSLMWSIDQALRCPAVATVWGPLEHINQRWFRRFQLSAEASGCIGLFIQPLSQARQPSWAEVQWIVGHALTESPSSNAQANSNPRIFNPRISSPQNSTAQTSNPREQLVRLLLTRCRGMQTGKSVNLSINTVTGNVQIARRDHETTQLRNNTRARKISSRPQASA